MIKNRKPTLEQRIARLEQSFNKNKRSRAFESYAEVKSTIDELVACAERLRDDARELMEVKMQLAGYQRSGAFDNLSQKDMRAIEEQQQFVDSCLQIVSDSLW